MRADSIRLLIVIWTNTAWIYVFYPWIYLCVYKSFFCSWILFFISFFSRSCDQNCARARDRAFIHALDFDPNKNTTLNLQCMYWYTPVCYCIFAVIIFSLLHIIILDWIYVCIAHIFSFFPCFPSFLLCLDVGMAVFVIPLRYLWEFVLYPRCFMRHVVWCEQAIWWKSAQVNEERWKKLKFGLSLPIDRTQCTWGNISVFVNSKYYLWKEKRKTVHHRIKQIMRFFQFGIMKNQLKVSNMRANFTSLYW